MEQPVKQRTCRLNGWCMTTKERAHKHIKRRLKLPDYYGCNLDALADCLGEMGQPTSIVLVNAGYMQRKLGDYGVRLLSLIMAATGENPRLNLQVRQGLFR